MPRRRGKAQFALLFRRVSRDAALRMSLPLIILFIPLIIPIYSNSRHNQIRGDSASRGSLPKCISHVSAKSTTPCGSRRAILERINTPASPSSRVRAKFRVIIQNSLARVVTSCVASWHYCRILSTTHLQSLHQRMLSDDTWTRIKLRPIRLRHFAVSNLLAARVHV